MMRIHSMLFLAVFTVPATAQTLSRHTESFPAALAFETATDGPVPAGWGGAPRATLSVDRQVARSGTASARIRRNGESEGAFSSLTAVLPVDFQGGTIRLRAFLRTDGVSGPVGLWMREDGYAGMVEFRNNAREIALSGTRDWQAYTVELPLSPDARKLRFGVTLGGSGTVWVDDVALYLDDRPIENVAKVAPKLSGWEQDREFDDGTPIAIDDLTAGQVKNLALLAKVWGFLKYHHPRVAQGDLNWDYELFRVLPAVMSATTAAQRNRALLDWARRIGDPDPCEPCAAPAENPQLLPDIGWIRDTTLLGSELSGYLERVYRNRPAAENRFYISARPGASNPDFRHELQYVGRELDDGHRLLALFRYWNMVEYWFPYRNAIGRPWDDVLREMLPEFVHAESFDDYLLALRRLMAAIHDTHALVYNHDEMLPPRGECWLPAAMRFVGSRAVAAKLVNDGARSIEVGDVLLEIDGTSVRQLLEQWRPFHSASNEVTLFRNMAGYMTRGPCGPAELRVRRGEETVSLHASRIPLDRAGVRALMLAERDLAGDTFQWLTEDIAYLKLSTIAAADVARYIEEAQGARCLIVDIRNYPHEFVTHVLGGHFVTETTEFAAFTVPDLANPGAFTWDGRATLEPQAPSFGGKVIVLVDESTLSQAEFTAMALRAGANTIVVGSTTAGADGNVSRIRLPGGVNTGFSGIGVFYPDGTPTQRVGIVPDVFVTPTIEGIRQGRDEVLERALREITGTPTAIDDAAPRNLPWKSRD